MSLNLGLGSFDVIGSLLGNPVIGPIIGPLYRILAMPGLGIIWGVAFTIGMGFLAALMVKKSPARRGPSKLTVGSSSAALPLIGRILMALLFVFMGGDSWTSYLGVLNLVALPFDLAVRAMLISRGRMGLALLPVLNFPIFPPYILQGAVLLSSVHKGGREGGIVVATARWSLAYLPIEVTDRVGDVKRLERDWILRDCGAQRVVWDPVAEGNPHMLVCGASGMGKSTFMYYLLVRLLMRGYPVTVLDPLGQYTKFAVMLELALKSGDDNLISEVFMVRDPGRVKRGWAGARLYNITRSGLNVFESVVGEPKIQVAEDLSYALAIVERQSPGATQHYLLTTSAVKLMEMGGKPKLSQLAALLDRVGHKLLEAKRPKAYEAAMNLAVRIRLLSIYLEPDGEPLNPRLLEAKPGDEKTGRWGELVVVDLSGIHDDDTRRIALELLLRKLRLHISRRPLAAVDKPWFIVVDEAWTLMKSHSEYRSVVNEMIREVRNRGVAMILLTQRSGDVDKDALANIGTKIYFKLGEETDVESLVEYTGCHLLREVIHQMDKHEGLILKRIAGVENVGKASMFRSGADMMLVGKIARLYPHEELWKRAEAIVEREKRAAERRIEELTAIIGEDEAVQTAVSEAVPKPAEQPEPANPRSKGGRGRERRGRVSAIPAPISAQPAVAQVARSAAPAVAEAPLTKIARAAIAFKKIERAVNRLRGRELEDVPVNKLAIIIAHYGKEGEDIPVEVLKRLTRRVGGGVDLQEAIIALRSRVIEEGGEDAVKCLELISKWTCPTCLSMLGPEGLCPECNSKKLSGRWVG